MKKLLIFTAVTILIVFLIQLERRTVDDTQDNGATTTAMSNQDTDLTPEELNALNTAIQDEYKAEQMYEAVMEKFGEIRPFSNIVNAEARHSEALANMFKQYNVPVPKPIEQNFTLPDSIQEVCELSVMAEEENIELYETYMKDIEKENIQHVFSSNMAASRDRHLPAFTRCAQ